MSQQPAFSPQAVRRKLLPTLIYAAIGPFLLYRVGTGHFHLSAVNALLLAALAPAAGSLIAYVRTRQVSVLGLVAFVGIATKVVSALLFHNARLVLISDSLLSGVFGLLLLGSVLIGKPVVVMLATSMYAQSPEQRAQLAQRLQASGLRRHLNVLTTMWGVGLLLMLAFSVLLAFTLPVASVLLIRPVIDFGVIGALIAGTIAYRWSVLRDRQRRPLGRQGQQRTEVEGPTADRRPCA
jgi:intracellular septation protein A